MNKGKYAARRSISVKALTLMLALVLVVGCVVGGTLAWLVDSTTEVKNVFTSADIEVTLTETFNTDTNEDDTNDKWQAQMIPGYSYTKDPKVTVKANSVDCYLFVKFEENNNASTYLTYTSTLSAENSGWTQGDGTDIPSNVWYRKVTSSTSDQSWELLSGNTISVKDSVTKSNMADAAKAELVYTAYASQLYKNNDATDNEFTPAQAWENISNPSGTTD